MTSIAIVSHCWCPPGLDDYAEMLKHQHASLVQNTAESIKVDHMVCCASDDEATMRAIKLCKNMDKYGSGNIRLTPMPLSHSGLFRRAIGRNIAAKQQECDVVWFTDVDYLFGCGAMETACRLVAGKDGLFQPREVQISFDNFASYCGEDRPHHCVGQKYLDKNRDVDFPRLDPSHFGGPWKGKAIGGVQVVSGETARKYGYLDGTSWVEPVKVDMGFRSCRCDRAYRVHMDRLGVPKAQKLDIPGVYRLRHLRDGRDVSERGELVGRGAW